ncbi:MAG: hypothetical protein K0Q68_2350 [Moraxellaceae bacterium]|jgi:hypothetical protein|nr:hypothetical protein [Moraxellaceae bacterium]
MKDVSEVLAKEVEARMRQQMARMLADALVGQLQIPGGAHLAMLIGDCRARDNRDAVRIWVARELPGEVEPNAHVYLEPLRQKLAEQLRRIGEGAG